MDRLDDTQAMPSDVRMQWGVKIPLRDGRHLSATLYLPSQQNLPAPVIFTLTPYVAQTYHDQASYFAANGYPFLTVDVRGRGNSEGVFSPFANEANDGFDVVEWLARQPYCNGQVAMWGGSYAGFNQWATAKELPPHLATIVPVAAPCMSVDFPLRGNIPYPYLMQWLTLVAGRASQDKIFGDQSYWGEKFRQWLEAGLAFKQLDTFLGHPSVAFQEWLSHPRQDAYWDRYNPTQEQYSKLDIPILTITGIYDGDQPGALAHYRQHLKHCSPLARSQHYLVIGPWNHAGTRTPQSEFCGLRIGPAGLLDLRKLHLEWYAWTMQQGHEPAFLAKAVAYYVMGAEKWRYADSLEEVTQRWLPLYLASSVNPTDVFHSGTLSAEAANSEPAHYVYDPRDVSHLQLESTLDPENRVDQRLTHALLGKQLIYHSKPFVMSTEISGFFKLMAWLSIDQPDTDFWAAVYEVAPDGGAVQLTTDWIRARYRRSLRQEELVRSTAAQCYTFENFTFVSRYVAKGSRLRLVIGPLHSVYSQKNYNSGGIVAEETMADARTVTVRLFHDLAHSSVLHVPLAHPETDCV